MADVLRAILASLVTSSSANIMEMDLKWWLSGLFLVSSCPVKNCVPTYGQIEWTGRGSLGYSHGP